MNRGDSVTAELPAAESAPGMNLLWARWREQGDAAAREQLIGLHLPYARILAATLYARRMYGDVEFDDYLQFARLGLMEALDRFDPAHGASFKTFASKRIQGAMLSGLVRLTEMGQQISVRAALRQERIQAVKESAAVSPAAQTGPDALFRYLADVGIGLAIGVLLEDTGMVDADAFESTTHALSPEVSYFRKTEIQQLRAALRDKVNQLSPQQKKVIACHYMQEMSFEQIAQSMRVSRARVSQLHREGLSRLRTLMADDARCDVSC